MQTQSGQRHNRQRGITLIEVCLVMAISGIVAGTAMPGMRGLLDGRRLGGAATQLATDIQFVRTEAIVRNQAVRVSFHASADSSCYVIHTGAAALCSCDTSGPAVCSAGAEQIRTVHFPAVEKVGLEANVGSVLFDPLHGTSSPSATLRVIGADGGEVHHVINIMGRVRSCTPHGAVAGYRPC